MAKRSLALLMIVLMMVSVPLQVLAENPVNLGELVGMITTDSDREEAGEESQEGTEETPSVSDNEAGSEKNGPARAPMRAPAGESVTWEGNGDTNAEPGIVFDAMAGVKATGSSLGELNVRISSIASTDAAYVFTPSDTTIQTGSENTEYTITYGAYDKSDTSYADTIGVTTRKVTVKPAVAYMPGSIHFTQGAGIDPAASTYNMQTDTSGTLTFRYVTPATGTRNTVLLVESLEYGAVIESFPTSSTAGIQEVYKIDDHKFLLRLADGLVSDFNLDVKMKTVALTGAQAGEWIDNGSLPPTRIAATEYYLPADVPLANALSEGRKYTEEVYCSVTPEIFPAEKIQNTYSFEFSVSSVAPIQDYMLYRVQTGWGGYTSVPGPLNKGILGYHIPAVHDQSAPLIEIKSIKLYVPDERLELEGLRDFGNTSYNSGVSAAEFDSQWNGWQVGSRQKDAKGSYYVITPPQRWFNNATDANLTADDFAFVPLWSLISLDDPLPWTPGAYTDYTGRDTEVTYKVAGESTDKVYSHTGARVQVWTQEEGSVINAYNPTRHEDGGADLLVVAGSYQRGEMFTYTTNAWRFSDENGIRTDSVPKYTGAVKQTYEFPHVIQPQGMTFHDRMQEVNSHNSYYFTAEYRKQLNGKMSEITTITYTTYDGVAHSVPQGQIDALNTRFADPLGGGHYGDEATTIGSVTFPDVSDTNPVVKVEVDWKHLATISHFGYASSLGFPPVTNTLSGGKVKLSGSMYTVGTDFDYIVDTYMDHDHTIPAAGKAQVKYSIASQDGTSVSHQDDKYLWFELMPQLCPYLCGKDAGYTESYYLNDSTAVLGDIGLFIGKYGERKDVVENPVINLSVEFHHNGTTSHVSNSAFWQLSNANKFKNMTEDQGIAFLSGKFTAMPKLSGWVFSYTTGKTTGVQTWTVPTITDEKGQVVQIPLAEGDYFTGIQLSYQGGLDLSHTGLEDTRDTHWLMQNIEITRHKRNPFTGEPIQLTDNYIQALIRLQGRLRFDNCSENEHNTPTGQVMKYEISSKGGIAEKHDTPKAYVYVTRQAEVYLSKVGTGAVPVPETVPTIYQGGGTSDIWHMNVQMNVANPTTQVGKPFGWEDSPNIHYRGNMLFPWEDIQHAVYIELTDPEFMVDLSNTTFYGYVATAPEIETDIVEAGGRRFLKIGFARGVYRSKVWKVIGSKDSEQKADEMAGWMESDPDTFRSYAINWYTATGPIKLAFTTVPGTALGIHHPVGDVYLDFSELLDKYNAPEATGYDSDRTNYTIRGVEDTLGLTDTKTSGEPKLMHVDGRSYAVNVIRATSVGVELSPGKMETLYDFATKLTTFKADEKDRLNGLVSLKAPVDNDIYEMTAYIKVPRINAPITWTDTAGTEQTTTSEYDMFLRSVPQAIMDSTGLSGNIHYYYTTDTNPGKDANYTAAPPADPAAITGIKVVADRMPAGSAVNVKLELTTADKKKVGPLRAYSGGVFHYKQSTLTAPVEGYVSRAAWEYGDYEVTQSNALVFWDTYNENGTKDGGYEPIAKGVVVELYDTDGSTLIDSATTDSAGKYMLHTYKADAGQIIRIKMPTNEGTEVRLTKASSEPMTKKGTDSDFNRATNELTLPLITKNGFLNISAGLVKLPKIKATDVTLKIGQTLKSAITLEDYLGMSLPDDSYNISVEASADGTVAQLAAQTFTTSGTISPQTRQVDIKGLKEGRTTARVYTSNTLGDVVETVFHITVQMTHRTIQVEKIWDDNGNALMGRPSGVEILLQRESSGEARNTVAQKILNQASGWIGNFTDMPEYDAAGERYTYTILEKQEGALLNYTPTYGGGEDGLSVTNKLNTVGLAGKKIWVENGAGFTRPDSLTINLYRSDSDAVYRTLNIRRDDTLTEQTFLFEDLLEYAPDGSEYTYRVEEAQVPSLYTAFQAGNYITNTYEVDNLKFEKKWDYTGAHKDARPSEVQLDLFRDDNAARPYLTVTLKEEDDWKTEVTIPRLERVGHTFTIREREVEGYEATYMEPLEEDSDQDGSPDTVIFKVANRFIMPLVSVSGTKTWKNLPENLAKPKVVVELTRDGEATGVTTLLSPDGTYAFEDLDKYDAEGNTYAYAIRELAIPGYTSAIASPVTDAYGNAEVNLTNTYSPKPVAWSPVVKKTVTGQDAPDDKFTFRIEGNNAAPMPGESTGQVKEVKAGAGPVEFGSITFDMPGSYSYRISEVAGDNANFTYDARVYTLKVDVRDENGELKISAVTGGDELGAVVFTNTYKKPTPASSSSGGGDGDSKSPDEPAVLGTHIVQAVRGLVPRTWDTNVLFYGILLVALSLTGIVGVTILERRRKRK